MVLFIWYVVLTFESVDGVLCCYRSNETSLAVLSGLFDVKICSKRQDFDKNLLLLEDGEKFLDGRSIHIQFSTDPSG